MLGDHGLGFAWRSPAFRATTGSFGIGRGGLNPKAALFWCFVGIPIAWGVWITLKNAIVIFQ
ncbi:MAG: hypothetical protein JO134_12740 [Xanthobacteraceae bacterium]|nr:hypothetical protein [Xanthobacteraceae bacterium]